MCLIICGPNVTHGKPSLTVCAAVGIAMMLSVGVSLMDTTHVGCGPIRVEGHEGTLSQSKKGGATGGKR